MSIPIASVKAKDGAVRVGRWQAVSVAEVELTVAGSVGLVTVTLTREAAHKLADALLEAAP